MVCADLFPIAYNIRIEAQVLYISIFDNEANLLPSFSPPPLPGSPKHRLHSLFLVPQLHPLSAFGPLHGRDRQIIERQSVITRGDNKSKPC